MPLIDTPGSLGLYVVMDLFIVLSPACYFAFNYIWFGRLVQRLEENMVFHGKRKHITFLPPSKFGKFFIISDVVTFLIQGSGGGLQVQKDKQKAGSVIFLIGIVAQFASYVLFVMLSIPLAYTLKQNELKSEQFYMKKRIKQLLYILYFSSVWIIVSRDRAQLKMGMFLPYLRLLFPRFGPFTVQSN